MTHAHVHQLRGRPLRPGDRQRLRHQQVGVPVLLAADGHRRQAVRRLDRHADHAERRRRRSRRRTPNAWDPYVGYFQLSRFKFVEDANGARAGPDSEQQILRVTNNRQECCHVAGDIDFDKHNNLWLVTGDDTPGRRHQRRRLRPVQGPAHRRAADRPHHERDGRHLHADLQRPDDGAARVQRDRRRRSTPRSRRSRTSAPTTSRPAAARPTRRTSTCSSAARWRSPTRRRSPADGGGPDGHHADGRAATTQQEGGWYQRPTGDDRRSTLNTNDLRGKLLRIKVKDGNIAAADANKADFGSGTGAYTIPAGNLFPLASRRAAGRRRRPEIYAMGFRNPFRVQVDENDVAYISDYSPDANTPQRSRGPSGVGRIEIVRAPGQLRLSGLLLGKLGYYRWNFHEFAPGTTTVGTPRRRPAAADRLRRRGRAAQRLALGASTAARASSPACADAAGDRPGHLVLVPRQPTRPAPLGTPCFGYYATTPGADRARLDDRVPAAVPGAVHGRRRRRTVSRSTTSTPPTRTPRSSRRTTTTR